MTSGSRWAAVAAVVAGMISIQTGASLAKSLFPVAGARGTAALRLALATLLLLLVWRPWRKWPGRESWKPLAVYGTSLGAMNLMFYLALARIPLGIAVAFEFCGPLAVAILASRRARDYLWAACAGVGLFLLLPLTEAQPSLDPAGVGFALGAGACWALYIIFGKRAGAAVHGGITTSVGMGIAALVVLPAGAWQAAQAARTPEILLKGLGVAALSSALPYSLEMLALQRLPTQTFGVLMSVEPAIAALSGLAILGERLHGSQWAAIALVMAASLGSTLSAPGKAAEDLDTAAEMTP